MERVSGVISLVQPIEPAIDQFDDHSQIQAFMHSRITGQIAAGKTKQLSGRFEPFFAEMNKSSGQLDQGFVERVFRAVSAIEPQFFKDIVRLVIFAGIEAFEEA